MHYNYVKTEKNSMFVVLRLFDTIIFTTYCVTAVPNATDYAMCRIRLFKVHPPPRKCVLCEKMQYANYSLVDITFVQILAE